MSGKQGKTPGPGGGRRVVATNRRARHDYDILDTYECGIVLEGDEVKSLRDGQVSLQDAFARVQDGEVWLHGMHVKPYAYAKRAAEPTRRRKLLLHAGEVGRLAGVTSQPGVTLVPLSVYFTHGLAKVELAVARGRRKYDKRQAIAEREARRDVERALRRRR